jgi:hypothetical protein
LDASERQSIADAADEIDRILASNPLDAGESREGNSRIMVLQPLTVLFDVDPDDRTVEVFSTFHWQRCKE